MEADGDGGDVVEEGDAGVDEGEGGGVDRGGKDAWDVFQYAI